MIINPFWVLIGLLGVHWVADFVCQTHWQASNKGKSNEALFLHVSIYTSVMTLAAAFVVRGPEWVIVFWVITFVTHFVTDYVTSRVSSRFFARAIEDTVRAKSFTSYYRRPPNDNDMQLMNCNPGRHWHNFFVVIGFDQLIHHVTLAATIWVLV